MYLWSNFTKWTERSRQNEIKIREATQMKQQENPGLFLGSLFPSVSTTVLFLSSILHEVMKVN